MRLAASGGNFSRNPNIRAVTIRTIESVTRHLAAVGTHPGHNHTAIESASKRHANRQASVRIRLKHPRKSHLETLGELSFRKCRLRFPYRRIEISLPFDFP